MGSGVPCDVYESDVESNGPLHQHSLDVTCRCIAQDWQYTHVSYPNVAAFADSRAKLQSASIHVRVCNNPEPPFSQTARTEPVVSQPDVAHAEASVAWKSKFF